MREPLTALVARLSALDEPVKETAPDVSFSALVTLAPGYVWPSLDTDGSSLESPVTLITAPGAMGKSAAARAIAASLNVPLVDLGRLYAGSNGLTGLLTRVLGWGTVATFVQKLQAGQAALILDGLDEAQLAAGRDSFQAFLGDIVNLLSGAAPLGQVVMFGRPDAVETTYLGFAELGIEPAQLRLAPLNHEQSCDLIDASLDRRVHSGRLFEVHRTHRAPFGKLRDAAFRNIAIALDTENAGDDYWVRAEHFLGYPPVLMSLAERLAVENPMSEMASLSSGVPGRRLNPGELLQNIVEAILDRESGKVRAQLLEPLGMAPTDARNAVLYSRDEQILRLLRHIGSAEIPVDAPAVLDPRERGVYEDLVSAFVPDHPFLVGQQFANAVFRDYVRAFAVTSPVIPLKPAAISGEVAVAGPFFADFVSSLGLLLNVPPRVCEDLVADLIRSNGVASSDGGGAFYNHDEDGAILMLTPSAQDLSSVRPERILIFAIDAPQGVLVLSGPISRLSLVTKYGLVLSSMTGTLSLGPNVAIFAGELELVASAVEVIGGDGEMGALLVASSCRHDAQLKLSVHNAPAMAQWPDMWQQWKPYAMKRPPTFGRLSQGTSTQVLLGLRRILMAFHSSVRDDPSAYREKFERFAVGGNKVFQATYEALQELGVIEVGGALLRLRLETLARFGVSYASLSGGHVEESLRSLHGEVCKSEQVQALA